MSAAGGKLERYRNRLRDRWNLARQEVALAEEKRLIQYRREGRWLGPSAWAVPAAANDRPAPLPSSIEVDNFTNDELRLAINLRVLTVDTLTSEQRQRFTRDDTPIPSSTMALLLKKLVPVDKKITA